MNGIETYKTAEEKIKAANVFRVNCAKENLGQIIGSQGKTIMGLRSIVHSMTARIGIRSIIEIPV